MTPLSIGLTGSIGMGKSTVAEMFRDLGVAIWDADETVHKLYGPGGAGTHAIAEIAPEAVIHDRVDRRVLADAIAEDPDLLKRVESVIHPLVADDRKSFKNNTLNEFVLFDIPLLFEGNLAPEFDVICVVSAPENVQKQRVLERPGMTPEKFEFILSKQMPDAEKRARADFVIETGGSLDDTRSQVELILKALRKNDPRTGS